MQRCQVGSLDLAPDPHLRAPRATGVDTCATDDRSRLVAAPPSLMGNSLENHQEFRVFRVRLAISELIISGSSF